MAAIVVTTSRFSDMYIYNDDSYHMAGISSVLLVLESYLLSPWNETGRIPSNHYKAIKCWLSNLSASGRLPEIAGQDRWGWVSLCRLISHHSSPPSGLVPGVSWQWLNLYDQYKFFHAELVGILQKQTQVMLQTVSTHWLPVICG